MKRFILALAGLVAFPLLMQAQEAYSGIYPHLAYFNNEGECGTGAVVPWADRLWLITYAPHNPKGSSDKLYEITSDRTLTARPESIGGTPANRMIHRESQQLFIGPYAIDTNRQVRVIPYTTMFGRLTGNARHLQDPANKLYCATMEEALYEIDVHSLAVKPLYYDEQVPQKPKADLPGYHGKGLYSGQGRVIYANNGENSAQARKDPFIPSGVLAEWDGAQWKVVLRHQFTEVTGPGGIYGNEHPAKDPVWSVGWDAKSLLLMVLDNGQWHRYRLPKASHTYDGAHGWNTEWPRIRDIGEKDLLMTMHGMFWRFPRTFSAAQSAGLAPRSTYLKIVGDFCRWQDRVVLGCDDTAKAGFLNERKAKGTLAAPQSQSNLWFLDPEALDHLGPILGRGAIWLDDPLAANEVSDPFLVSGFRKRSMHLVTDRPTTITIELDAEGNGRWKTWAEVEVDGYRWQDLDLPFSAAWIRLRTRVPLQRATAWVHMAGDDDRPRSAAPLFDGLAKVGEPAVTGGLLAAMADNQRTLEFAAQNEKGEKGYYLLDENMRLVFKNDAAKWNALQKKMAIPSREGILHVDDASVIFIDDDGKRYRLPRSEDYLQAGPLGWGRLCREVVTERDLFHCHGTFYELPAKNAGGFSRIQPISTHPFQITDYASYRGLLVLSGIHLKAALQNRHILRSDDGKTALWVGALDDLWKLGRPRGRGGPWLNTRTKAGVYSDPYLMTGYKEKMMTLESAAKATLTLEVDISGMGDWHPYRSFSLEAGEPVDYTFPPSFQAYWVRLKTDVATTATAQFIYQ